VQSALIQPFCPTQEFRMARTSASRNAMTGGPAIILCEPQLGENIGMVARAMANFGLSELRIVNPRDGWPNEKARSAAANAQHVIADTKVYDDLPSAIADLRFVYATTARQREALKPVRGPVEAAMRLRRHETEGLRTGILFGRERWGLNNEEISLSDEIVTFPVNPAFASLNIAQAVLLMSYEWMKTGLESELDLTFKGPDMVPAPKEHTIGLFGQLEEALAARGYFRPKEKTEVITHNLRAVLMRAAFTTTEIRLLRGVVNSLDNFSRQSPKGAGAPEGRARVKTKEADNASK
jgi:tRNA/rRNA methyltransferase